MRTPNALAIILGVIAVVCGLVLVLDVRNPEVAIAIGLIASGAGLVVLAT